MSIAGSDPRPADTAASAVREWIKGYVPSGYCGDALADLDVLVDEHAMMEAALREIERWPAPIDGGKVRAIASAAIGRLSRV